MFKKYEIKVWANKAETEKLLAVLNVLNVEDVRTQEVEGLMVTSFVARKGVRYIIDKINKNVSVFMFDF